MLQREIEREKEEEKGRSRKKTRGLRGEEVEEKSEIILESEA